MTRPTAYPPRRRQDPAPADARLAMRYQMPADPAPLEPMPTPGPPTATASEATPELHEARPDSERTRLLERIAEARVSHRQLCLLLLEVEGIAAFSDSALQRMCAVLDAIEAHE